MTDITNDSLYMRRTSLDVAADGSMAKALDAGQKKIDAKDTLTYSTATWSSYREEAAKESVKHAAEFMWDGSQLVAGLLGNGALFMQQLSKLRTLGKESAEAINWMKSNCPELYRATQEALELHEKGKTGEAVMTLGLAIFKGGAELANILTKSEVLARAVPALNGFISAAQLYGKAIHWAAEDASKMAQVFHNDRERIVVMDLAKDAKLVPPGFCSAELKKMSPAATGFVEGHGLRKAEGALGEVFLKKEVTGKDGKPVDYRRLEGDVNAGKSMAIACDFRTHADVALMLHKDPKFLAAYLGNPAFALGVDAVIWERHHDKKAFEADVAAFKLPERPLGRV